MRRKPNKSPVAPNEIDLAIVQLNIASRGPITVAELVELTGLQRPTVIDACALLSQRDRVSFDSRTNCYRVNHDPNLCT